MKTTRADSLRAQALAIKAQDRRARAALPMQEKALLVERMQETSRALRLLRQENMERVRRARMKSKT